MSARIFAAARVVTCDERRATARDPLGALDDGGVLIEDARVVAVGTRVELVARAPQAQLHDAPGSVITPGLVDAHTHAAWAGSRHDEYARRLAGAGYEEIAAAGGGIRSTMRAVRAASRGELADALTARLARMRAAGVTTVEVKSGYGLDPASERKQLEAIAEASARAGAPRVIATYLALHAVPPDAGARDAWIARQIAEIAPFARERLASFVDAYIDRAAFSADEARPLCAAARDGGLGVRLHVGQFADVGGARLASDAGAASVDHVEHVAAADLDALAAAGTRAVMLPVASFTLSQAPPDVAALRAAGVPLVVASDANPGTAPTESLPLALALAVRTYGLTPAEAILGATREAARSLRVEAGVLAEGAPADLVVWDLPHELALLQPWGVSRAARVIVAGEG